MWEVKGCCWELYATAILCQSFFNLLCSPKNTSMFLAFINPPTNAAAPRKLVLKLLFSLLHALSVLFVFPSPNNTGTEHMQAAQTFKDNKMHRHDCTNTDTQLYIFLL